MNGLTSSCRVRQSALGDWQIFPTAGQYVQVGDGPAAVSVPMTGNDDLNVTGNMEVEEILVLVGETEIWNAMVAAGDVNITPGIYSQIQGDSGCYLWLPNYSEVLEVPDGAMWAWGAFGLGPPNSVMIAVVTRVLQAPGGGFSTAFSIGRSSNAYEFVDERPVTLGSTTTSMADGDGTVKGPIYNKTARVFKITSDGTVFDPPLRVRVTVYYIGQYAHTS